jgi:hypothetical protein
LLFTYNKHLSQTFILVNNNPNTTQIHNNLYIFEVGFGIDVMIYFQFCKDLAKTLAVFAQTAASFWEK